MATRAALDRLLAKREINPETGCREYTGYRLRGHGRDERLSGYAYIRDDAARGSRQILVHKLAWRELIGPARQKNAALAAEVPF